MRGIAAVVLLCVAIGVAHADCPVPAGAAPALAARSNAERLAWIQARLARSSHKAKVWMWSWMAGILGATAIDLSLIPIFGDTRSARIDFGLGAATTIVGVVPFLVLPPPVIADHRALDHLVATSKMNDCAMLADAERRLRADAKAAKLARAWWLHAANVVFNAGVTLLFGAFDHWTSGIVNGAGGFVVGELIIYTAPVDDRANLRHYLDGDLDAPQHTALQLVPLVDRNAMGLQITFAF